MEKWTDPVTGKKYKDKAMDFDFDVYKSFKTIKAVDSDEYKDSTKKEVREFLDANEERIIEMRLDGKTNLQIAAELGVSEYAVNVKMRKLRDQGKIERKKRGTK